MNKEYVFVLGRSPELSILELEAVFSRGSVSADITKLTTNIAVVKIEIDSIFNSSTRDRNPELVHGEPIESIEGAHLNQDWFNKLGGSIKMGRVLGILDSQSDLRTEMAKHISSRVVGISGVNFRGADKLALRLKKDLKLKRYVVAPAYEILTSAQSKGILQKGQEFLLIKSGDEIYITEVIAVQNIDDFTKRDRYLPYVDAKRGMLPTKLARIMVNIGIGLSKKTRPVIFDPFCGMGRVLMEALLVGADVRGSDIDAAAVEATRKNLEWTANQYLLGPMDWDNLIRQADIANTTSVFGEFRPDVIVTEPYLGPPLRTKISSDEIRRIFDAVEPLYVNLFRTAQLMISNNAGIVVVFPVINDISLLEQLVDKIQGLGYNILDSVKISREDQFVGREIAVFKKF